VYRGAIRSGKTYVGAIKTVIECMRGKRVLSISPTYQMAVDNVEATLVEVCEMMGVPIDVKMSKKRIYIGSGYVIFRTAEAVEAIRGFEADHMWIDEGSFMKSNEAYRRGIGRLSGDPNRQVWITSSPSGKDWVYKLSRQDNCQLFTQALYDNYFLDEGFFQILLKEYGGEDSKYARQEIYGEIVTFESGFFPASRIIKSKSLKPSSLCGAFDLGFGEKKSSDYSAYALCGFDYDDNFNIIHVERWKQEPGPTKEKIIDIISHIPDVPHLIESNGPQSVIYKDIVADPRMRDYLILPSNSTMSKPARGIGLANKMNIGKVIMHDKSFFDMVSDELGEFTMNDTHENDDMVDTIVMDYNYLKWGDASMSRVRV
jgi:hypothetical protein